MKTLAKRQMFQQSQSVEYKMERRKWTKNAGGEQKKIWRDKSVLGIKGHACHNIKFTHDLEDDQDPLTDFEHGSLRLGKITMAAILRTLNRQD